MRTIVVNLDKGMWKLALLEHMEIVHVVNVANYHQIGSIASNWIVNRIVENE